MILLRFTIALIGIGLALTVSGFLQTLSLLIAAVAITSLFHSLVLRHRLNQLIKPEREFLEGEGPVNDQLDLLSRTIKAIRGKLKRRVERLAAERDRLGVLLEGMAEGVVSLDAQGRINGSNDAGRALFDIQGDGEGLSLIEALRVPALHGVVQRALLGEAGEAEFERLEGRSLLARVRPLKSGGAVIVILDLTEVRRLERVRKDFVANVEHELRTPVAVIQSSSEVLVAHAGLEGQSLGLAEAIHRHAERLGLLIASLLELSRLEAGQHQTTLEPIPLMSVLERGLLLCREQAEAAGIKTRNEYLENWVVQGDVQAMEQVLVNLVGNGIKYGGHEVVVGAKRLGDLVEISVEDDGNGIEPRHQSRLFERFYRVDGGRSRDSGGSGLGLAIVKHLCQAMGGSVRFEERLPHGSRFVVTLMAATPHPGKGSPG